MIQIETKENLKGQLETIFWEFIKSKTDIPAVLKDSDNLIEKGYPRIEFEIIEINLNQENMSISNECDYDELTIIDNYNRTSRYMLDFVLVHTPGSTANIDSLIKYFSNYWKLDRYFNHFDYSQYDIEDITVNHDFKTTNKSAFYLDQSIKRDGYSFTFDVETTDKDIIPMGIHMKRGEFIE